MSSLLQQHEFQMAALAGTRLDMCRTPQQIAAVNPSKQSHHVFVFQHNYNLCAPQLLLRGFTPFIVGGGPAPQCLSNIQMGRGGEKGLRI